jgi:hypothetical protein
MINIGIRRGLAAILGAGALVIGVGESLADDPASELRALRNSMNINLRNDPNLRQNMDFHLREYEIQETEARARASAASQTEEIKEEIRRQSEGKEKKEPEKDVSISACNYFIDLNKDGFVDCPNEFVGYGKTKFRKGEVLSLVAWMKGHKGKKATIAIYGPNGEQVNDSWKITGESAYCGYLTHGEDNLKDNWVTRFIRKGGAGTYKAAISIDGKVIDSCDFETEGFDEPVRETAKPASAKEANPAYNAPKQKDVKISYEQPKPRKYSGNTPLSELTDEEFAKLKKEMPDVRAAMEKCYNGIAAEATNKSSRNFMIDYGDVQRK